MKERPSHREFTGKFSDFDIRLHFAILGSDFLIFKIFFSKSHFSLTAVCPNFSFFPKNYPLHTPGWLPFPARTPVDATGILAGKSA